MKASQRPDSPYPSYYNHSDTSSATTNNSCVRRLKHEVTIVDEMFKKAINQSDSEDTLNTYQLQFLSFTAMIQSVFLDVWDKERFKKIDVVNYQNVHDPTERLSLLIDLLEKCSYDRDIFTSLMDYNHIESINRPDVDDSNALEDGQLAHVQYEHYLFDEIRPSPAASDITPLVLDSVRILLEMLKEISDKYTPMSKKQGSKLSKVIHNALTPIFYEDKQYYTNIYEKDWNSMLAKLILMDILTATYCDNGCVYTTAKDFLLAITTPAKALDSYLPLAAHIKIHDLYELDVVNLLCQDAIIESYADEKQYRDHLLLRAQLLLEIPKSNNGRIASRLFKCLIYKRDREILRIEINLSDYDSDFDLSTPSKVPVNTKESSKVQQLGLDKMLQQVQANKDSYEDYAEALLDCSRADFTGSNNSTIIINTLRYMGKIDGKTVAEDKDGGIHKLLRFRQNLDHAILFILQDLSLALSQDYPNIKVSKDFLIVLSKKSYEYQCEHIGASNYCTYCDNASKAITACTVQEQLLSPVKSVHLKVECIQDYFEYVMTRCRDVLKMGAVSRNTAAVLLAQRCNMHQNSHFQEVKNNVTCATQTDSEDANDKSYDKPNSTIGGNTVVAEKYDSSNIKLHMTNHALKLVSVATLALSTTATLLWGKAVCYLYAVARLVNMTRLTYGFTKHQNSTSNSKIKAWVWLMEITESVIVAATVSTAVCTGSISLAIETVAKVTTGWLGSLVVCAAGYIRASKKSNYNVLTTENALPSTQLPTSGHQSSNSELGSRSNRSSVSGAVNTLIRWCA